MPAVPRTSIAAAVLAWSLGAPSASATPPPADAPPPPTTTIHHHHETIVETVDDRREPSQWFGLYTGVVATPFRPDAGVRLGTKRVTSNAFDACLDPFDARYCSQLRGFDLRFAFFESKGSWRYPRWMLYFRTGYAAGRVRFDPREGTEGFEPGQATSLSYVAVPLFLGANVYLFEKFPVRPFGGMGFGFDAVRLDYRRHDARRIQDASARIGFELHAGLEARISNYVTVSAEIQQLWSARRKLEGVPDFSNEGLTLLAGVSIGIPVAWRRDRKVREVHRVERHEHPPVPTTTVIVEPAPVPAAPAVAPPPATEPLPPPTAPTLEAPAAPPPVTSPAPPPV